MRLFSLGGVWPALRSLSCPRQASRCLLTYERLCLEQRRYRAAVPADHHSQFGKGADLLEPHKDHRQTPGQQQAQSLTKGLERAPKNAVGVQLLAPSLHAQIFPAGATKIPPVHSEALSLSQHHLLTHGLQPEQASTLAPITFDLPPLQGKDLSEHFWHLGRQTAQPWLGMAHKLAATEIFAQIPRGVTSATQEKNDEGETLKAVEWLALDASTRSEAECSSPKWLRKSGWVRYPVLQSEDGKAKALGDGEPVPYPLPEDGALSFDVETMVQESPYAVMATAAGSKAWYAWLSPWLLQEGERCHEKDHLIPFGPDEPELRSQLPARLLIGHNVAYDRARVRDEYSMSRSNIRFLDTMSLHVATRGISSPQRGAWMRHSKSRALEKMLDQDDVEEVKKEVIKSLLGGEEIDEELLAELDLEELVRDLQGGDIAAGAGISADSFASNGANESEISSNASQLWQDVTSNNSLADVAKLHCNIDMSKEKRNVFVDGTSRVEILSMLDSLLDYCANDVLVTHKVFQKVWTAFIKNCPNPATTAGVLGLGSAILPVDDEWVDYIDRCDVKYQLALTDVRENLVKLAEDLRSRGTSGISWDQAMEAANARMEDLDSMEHLTYADKLAREEHERLREKLWWEEDRWASQLDWTPKNPKKDRSLEKGVGQNSEAELFPRWYRDKVLKSASGLGPSMAVVPNILRLHWAERPISKRSDGRWIIEGDSEAHDIDIKGSPLRQAFLKGDLGAGVQSGLGEVGEAVLTAIRASSGTDVVRQCLREAADALVQVTSQDHKIIQRDVQLASLDWTPSEYSPSNTATVQEGGEEEEMEWWPKWYWDLYKSATGQLEVTIRTKIAPVLLCVTWQGCPLQHSREHGWVFRYDPREKHTVVTRQKQLVFRMPADQPFRNDITRTVASRIAEVADKAEGKDNESIDPFRITPRFYKVPHLAGDDSNVGSPFSKGYLPFFEGGTMQSEHSDAAGRQAAKNALEMNAQCSYWIGVRDRVKQQMVVWEGQGGSHSEFLPGASGARGDDAKEQTRKKGIILPQVVPMGTVTRRAIEKTWLTASNAKPNRVGSELKALVKAPPGWSIVGADVDSQELWICSVMGDAQFGVHGATAIGWMTLEGTKAAGTDLHSKTASILGTSRNQAKIFNYSRIYGAGIRHSSQLLLKADPSMTTEEATRKAKELYANTKGTNTQRADLFGRKFWYGGTESYVFNKLEEIALSEQPRTPALDCGVTAALSKQYLPKKMSGQQGGGDFMPSRINWVVQSSGVDYLHLLITAMEYLISTYDLQARFMISVHDEVRYLAKDEDAHRVALALQISNLWTRAMFAHKLQMDNLPQSVAFFSQVDIDKVLRKEADDPCVTPSQPIPIPAGKAEEILSTLEQTHGGSLFADGSSMRRILPDPESRRAHLIPQGEEIDMRLPKYTPSKQIHRSTGDRGLRFLQAQASDNVAEISALEHRMRLMESRARSSNSTEKSVPRRSAAVNESSKLTRVSGKRSHESNEWEPSPFGSSYGLHTSARCRTAIDVKPLQDIVSSFPPRPMRYRVPFYKTCEHRQRILWHLYRPLLKGCRSDFPHIRQMIKGLTRAKRHCTSPQQTEELVQRGMRLVERLLQNQKGDESERQSLLDEDEAIAVKQQHRMSNSAFGRYMRSVEEDRKPIPRLTGGLLPPSFSNPPLLRYKPVQPDSITMSIFKRRLARQRRMERQSDNAELQRLVQSEVALWAQLEDRNPGQQMQTGWEDKEPWLASLRMEKQMIREAFNRDTTRAQMVYPEWMLALAKNVRRRRIAENTKKNLRRRSSQQQGAASPVEQEG